MINPRDECLGPKCLRRGDEISCLYTERRKSIHTLCGCWMLGGVECRGIDDNPISMDGTSWIIRLPRAIPKREEERGRTRERERGRGRKKDDPVLSSSPFPPLCRRMELLNSVFLDSRDSNREKIRTA